MSFPPLPELSIALSIFAVVGSYAYILHWFGSKEIEKHHSHSILAPTTHRNTGTDHEEELRQAA